MYGKYFFGSMVSDEKPFHNPNEDAKTLVHQGPTDLALAPDRLHFRRRANSCLYISQPDHH